MLKGMYCYWKIVMFSWGLKQMEVVRLPADDHQINRLEGYSTI